ncbi:MAG: Hsp33 family molecular chaperone HslO [Spirochaetia bacterium]|jgi:molecular chaperone Hsp33|nr:Hsp33 family molecular chaperone HslO [Spirochaetia bacterium]
MTKQKITDNTLNQHLSKIEPDKIDVFLLNKGTVRGALLHGTKMINQMRLNHNLGILETLALGQAYMGAGLMTSMIKGNDRISFAIECGGPIKGLSVEANADGQVRGYLFANPIPITNPVESFDLSPFFGPGFLSVTKHLESSKQPFTGQVMLQHGRIARDLANYFLESEQIKTAFVLSVFFDKDGRAVGAGGLFLQALPGAEATALNLLEDFVQNMPSLGKYFATEGSSRSLINSSFKDFHPEIIGEKSVAFDCGCTKERFTSFLASMDISDKDEILKNGPFPLVTTCHNCGTDYNFSKEELQAIFSN